jgi:solute carrier family 25 carnitine/acylcarnitine transporter 20/29
VKVRLQTDAVSSSGGSRFNGPLHCIRETVRHDGFRGLYRGATPPLIGWTAIDSVMFAALGAARRQLLNGENRQLTLSEHALCGFAAGMAASFIANPVELVKTKLQTNYSGSWDNGVKLGSLNAAATAKLGPITCVKQIWRDRGVVGFYRGMTGTLLFRSFVSVYIASYEYFKILFAEWNMGPTMFQNFMAGGMAANVLWITSFPTDVVKNRMMADESYKTVPQTFRRIYAEGGVRAFYRGFVPCMLRSFPTNGAAFLAMELVVKYWPTN